MDQRTLDADVIVIGAGMAGLSAAHSLLLRTDDNSIDDAAAAAVPPSVLILEARGRIGGRIHTVDLRTTKTTTSNDDQQNGCNDEDEAHTPVSKAAVDMGATWIHGYNKKNPIIGLAERLQTQLQKHYWNSGSYHVYDDQGKKLSKREVERANDRVQKLLLQAKKHARSKLQSDNFVVLSMKEAIQETYPHALEDPLQRAMICLDVEFDYGGSLDDLHAAWYDEDGEFPGCDVIPLGGYRPLVEDLAKRLDIRFYQAVCSIDYGSPDGVVTVTTTQGQRFYASKVICTLPLGILKSGDVSFTPSLSASKQGAVDRLGWGGAVNKVALAFDRVFWPCKEAFVMASVHPTYGYILNKYASEDGPAILEVYAIGSHASKMEDQEEESILSDVLGMLSDMFQQSLPDLQSWLVDFRIGCWNSEIYTKGAYSFTSCCTKLGDYEAFLEPEQGVLFFAGEHTIQEYRGTVHGAFLSGQRVAGQVLERWRRKTTDG